ncbi:hypothetical protein NMY22_g127 [Coprinellus aureogranulatus]|nr:hypothetical protein NMY22_g127 [Coprinellus aureogranulatus]
MEQVPIHPVHGVQDWDAPAGAIDWQRLVDTLRSIKQIGRLPPDHRSHDHLNEQKHFPVDPDVEERLVSELNQALDAARERTGKKTIFGILDGFLLYWHPDVIAQLDVPIMLRVPESELKRRRTERHGYHTAAQSDMVEGALWRDPPGYWEDIVWPAYVEAHRDLFIDKDVEGGQLSGDKVPNLVLSEPLQMSTTEVVAKSCDVIRTFLDKSTLENATSCLIVMPRRQLIDLTFAVKLEAPTQGQERQGLSTRHVQTR